MMMVVVAIKRYEMNTNNSWQTKFHEFADFVVGLVDVDVDGGDFCWDFVHGTQLKIIIE